MKSVPIIPVPVTRAMTNEFSQSIWPFNHIIYKISFQGCRVLICDFHREQAWERWVSKSENGVLPQRGEVLRLLRCVAHADSQDAYDSALASLLSSDAWEHNRKLQEYMEAYWLPKIEVRPLSLTFDWLSYQTLTHHFFRLYLPNVIQIKGIFVDD